VTDQGKANHTRLSVRLIPAMFIVGAGFMLSQIFANAGPASADDPNGKVTICHATGSSTNPFVLITVNEHAGPAHLGGPNVNSNGNADHKGHGDIKVNPGSVNPGTLNPGSIGHGPITAAECEQLAGGAAAPTPAPAGPTAAIKDAEEDTPAAVPATDDSEDLPNPGHGASPEIKTTNNTGKTTNNAGTPQAPGGTQPKAAHPAATGPRSTGGLPQQPAVSQGGVSSAVPPVPQPNSGAASNGNASAGNVISPNVGPPSKGNGGANTPKNQPGRPNQPGSGGHQPAGQPPNQGHRH
jgi:hypothetical protein